MDNKLIISSVINLVTGMDAQKDGKSKIVVGTEDKKIGYVDPYGNVKELLGIDMEEKSKAITGGDMIEYQIEVPVNDGKPLQIKLIKVTVTASVPTDLTIDYINPFASKNFIIIGSHNFNDNISGLMFTSTRESFNLKFRDGALNEGFSVISIGN